MSSPKTRPTTVSAHDFLAGLADFQLRTDCEQLVKIMSAVTKAPPVMWGPGIVGFGTYHYVYASGREGDWMLTGFAPRGKEISIYLMSGFEPHAELLKQLGPHKTGKACLYVKRLSDLHLPTLKKLIQSSVKLVEKWQGCPPTEQTKTPARKRSNQR